MNVAVLFPGQGSQKVGMGLDLYNETLIGKEIFNKVDELTRRKISSICFSGPEEELNQTKNTQVAIVTISVLLTLIFEENLNKKNLIFKPFCTAGHSLGEFTSLWFTGILAFEDLIRLVTIRGELMQNAPSGEMAAILNTDLENLEKILNRDEFKNEIVIANYNNPAQFVISGKKELFNTILDNIKQIGGKTIILPTSGAFHSPLMKEPANLFSKELDKILPSELSNKTFKRKIPIYQNYDARPSTDYRAIREKITKQMTSPVYWTQTINNLVNDGVDTVIEIGPGKVLSGLVKKINSKINSYNICDLETLKDFIVKYEQFHSRVES